MLYETQHLKQRENFSGTFARDKTFKMETTVGLAGRGRGKALCMKSLQVARRFFTRTTFVLVASAVVWKGASLNAYAQYSNTSEDLKDIVAEHPTKGHLEPGMHQPSPIGNLGNLDVVVDLRGFVPMSFWSATAAKATFAGHSDNFKGDVLRWYKIPTKKALLMLYFGDLTSTHIADDTTKLESRFAKTRFLKESDASGANLGCLNPFILGEVGGNGDIAIGNHSLCGNRDLVRQRNHYIGLTDGPALLEFRRGRQVAIVARGRAHVHPGDDGVDLLLREAAVVRKMAVGRIRQPGRHSALQYFLADGLGPRAHLFVGDQRHGSGLSGAMALHAATEQNGRDVLCVSCMRVARARGRERPGGAHQRQK